MAMSDYLKKGGEANKLNPLQNKYHDYYNIVALPIVCISNVAHLYSCAYAKPDPDPLTFFSLTRMSESITFDIVWWCFLLYILIDTIWITLYPHCVVAPNPILIHHFLLILGWLVIFDWPGYEFYMSASLLVEINTFFLIAKRQISCKYNPNLFKLFYYFDHISWCIIRVIGMPCMNYNGYCIWRYLSDDRGNFLNSGMYVFLAGCLITYQNLMWTRDKYLKKSKSNDDDDDDGDVDIVNRKKKATRL